MHEIDPQSEARLTEALRKLASSSPQAARPEIGIELLGQFRRHHARRRRIRITAILGLAACIVLTASLSLQRPSQHHQVQENFAKTVTGAEDNPPSALPVVAAISKQAKKTIAKQRLAKPAAAAANRAFLALPAYDPTVPMEDLQVVRVQLPASALWKMGAPIPADADERRMTADFVVGQDGTAYAVRLVQ